MFFDLEEVLNLNPVHAASCVFNALRVAQADGLVARPRGTERRGDQEPVSPALPADHYCRGAGGGGAVEGGAGGAGGAA